MPLRALCCCCDPVGPCLICYQATCAWSETSGAWHITNNRYATSDSDARLDITTHHPDGLATGYVTCTCEVDNLGDTVCLYYGNRHRVEVVTGGDGCVRLYQDDELLWIRQLNVGNSFQFSMLSTAPSSGAGYAKVVIRPFPTLVGCSPLSDNSIYVPISPPSGDSFAWGTKAVTGEVRFKCTQFWKAAVYSAYYGSTTPGCTASTNPGEDQLCIAFCDFFSNGVQPYRTTLGCAWETTGTWSFAPNVNGALATGLATATPRQPLLPIGAISTTPQMPDVLTTGVEYRASEMTGGTTIKLEHGGQSVTYTHGNPACLQLGDGSVWKRNFPTWQDTPPYINKIRFSWRKDCAFVEFLPAWPNSGINNSQTLMADLPFTPGVPTLTVNGSARLNSFDWFYTRESA